MARRPMLRKCGACGEKAVGLAVVPYQTRVDHDGQKYDISLDALNVPQCSNCSEIYLDDNAEEAIYGELRRQARLLTPQAIRAFRESHGLSQKALGEDLVIAPETISRWETGSQIQSMHHDRMLRAYFANPSFRETLKAARIEACASDFEREKVSGPVLR